MWKRGKNLTEAISFQSSWQWRSADSTEFDRTLSEPQMLCMKNASMHLRHIYRITQRFGLEGTFKDHISLTPDISQGNIEEGNYKEFPKTMLLWLILGKWFIAYTENSPCSYVSVFCRCEDQKKEQKTLQWYSPTAHCRKHTPHPGAGCRCTGHLLGCVFI